jgi:S-adenosylmethionine hydrolase
MRCSACLTRNEGIRGRACPRGRENMDVKPSGIITLLTDFGLSDPYVGIMKGVILSIHPEARLVDISHEVHPGAVRQAASLLEEAYPFFPPGTIHLTVVDPGVGSGRRPIGLKAMDQIFVGPDNGVFSALLRARDRCSVVHLTEERFFLSLLSHTFHGRDIFAPVAAHLARGVDLLGMGAQVNDPVCLDLPTVMVNEHTLRGEVTRVDRFGNIITNIPAHTLESWMAGNRVLVTVGRLSLETIGRTFSDVAQGRPVALVGSSGHLEIAVNLGRASDRLGVSGDRVVGTKVEVRKMT